MKSDNLPLVSILIPVYNRADLVCDAVNSAIKQTYPHLEILIHDDASTDTTWRVLQQYRRYPHVRLIHTSKNHGMIGGWNYLMKKARGKYVKFLASDDTLTPDCAATEALVLEQNSRAALASCRREFLDLTTGRSTYLGFSDHDTIYKGRTYAHELLTTLRENKIGEPTAVMFRRRLVSRAGYFDPSFSQFADFEYWIRLLEFGDLAYVHKTLCTFRLHQGSSTSSAQSDGRFISETYRLINKYYSSPRYRRVFNLSDSDRGAVTRLKNLDFLKNIKDLLVSGNLARASLYVFRLRKSY